MSAQPSPLQSVNVHSVGKMLNSLSNGRVNLHSSPSRQPSPKRRRVALACRACRERKVRCDGARPVCGTCRKRGSDFQHCEYTVIADTAKYQTERAYIQSLRDHISGLERATHQTTRITADMDRFGPELRSMYSEPSPSLFPAEEEDGLVLKLEGGTYELPIQTATTPCLPTGMGSIATPADHSHFTSQLYEQSSIVSLVEQCAQGPSLTTPPSQGTRPTTPFTTPNSLTSFPFEADASAIPADDYSLPPRSAADSLLDEYFANVYVFYPWFHKETFLKAYARLWSDLAEPMPTLEQVDIGLGGGNCDPTVFQCALNAIFAQACGFSKISPEEKRRLSFVFYERMQNLVNIDFLDSGSLSEVQTLLLVGQYLQCTPHPRRCWNVVGMAYRMSVGLGLHLNSYPDEMPAVEREMRRRIWCACVQMDINASMTMGRPAMTVHHQPLPLPYPIDDPSVTGEQTSETPNSAAPENQFTYENMKLIEILGDILTKIYRDTGVDADVRTVNFQDVTDIDHALEDFETSLHPALHWGRFEIGKDATNPVLKRQSNILHARFLHLKFLLYRPAFSDYCSAVGAKADRAKKIPGASSRSWSRKYLENCAVACVQSACDIIECLTGAAVEDTAGAWWYGAFPLINAGIILIFADANRSLFGEIERGDRNAAWNQCLETLHRMVDIHPSARDYAIAFRDLKQKYSGPQGFSRNRHILSSSGSLNRIKHNPRKDELLEYQGKIRPMEVLEENNESYPDDWGSLLLNWGSRLEDITLPAEFLQEMDEGLLLPNLI